MVVLVAEGITQRLHGVVSSDAVAHQVDQVVDLS